MNDKNTPQIFGYIYRIFNKGLLTRNDAEEIIEFSYIGRTEVTVQDRYRSHLRSAANFRGSDADADGKLYAVMSAHGTKGFEVEELAIAYSPDELSQLEAEFQEKYDSIKHGWNKIAASKITRQRNAEVLVEVDGFQRAFQNEAELCRQLRISPSSLTHWKKKCESLQLAVNNALHGKKRSVEKQNTTIFVFRKEYKTINEAARDAKLNVHKFSPHYIRTRVSSGMSYEEAFKTPRTRSKKTLEVVLPDGSVREFQSLKEMYDSLKIDFDIRSYSTIVSYVGNKGYTLEQALGFQKSPWETKYEEYDNLVKNQGYVYVGEKMEQSVPVVLHKTKEVFTSVKLLAQTYDLEYTSLAEKLKAGHKIEDILKKTGHIK